MTKQTKTSQPEKKTHTTGKERTKPAPIPVAFTVSDTISCPRCQGRLKDYTARTSTDGLKFTFKMCNTCHLYYMPTRVSQQLKKKLEKQRRAGESNT